MKTPEQIAAKVLDEDTAYNDMRSTADHTLLLMTQAIEADRAQRPSGWTNGDGISYELYLDTHTVGFRITEEATGKVEYMLLSPTEHHDINPENGATADTFVYHVDHLGAESYQEAPDDGTVSIVDFAYPAIYLNHFNGSWTHPEDF